MTFPELWQDLNFHLPSLPPVSRTSWYPSNLVISNINLADPHWSTSAVEEADPISRWIVQGQVWPP